MSRSGRKMVRQHMLAARMDAGIGGHDVAEREFMNIASVWFAGITPHSGSNRRGHRHGRLRCGSMGVWCRIFMAKRYHTRLAVSWRYIEFDNRNRIGVSRHVEDETDEDVGERAHFWVGR